MKDSTREGLERYRDHKIPTGGFLRAVLENDLKEAFARADQDNIRDMFEILKYLYTDMPIGCHGSPAKVQAWLESAPSVEYSH